MSLHRLLPLFERARESNEPVVLATVVRTGGSTYAKPGAQMLIASDGEYAGLLSGGCLEGDLREHARAVAASGTARIVSYDLRSTTDQLFGLGAGCEGAMDILLARLGPEDGWQPLPHLADARHAGRSTRLAFVIASGEAGIPTGLTFPLGSAAAAAAPADPRVRDLADAVAGVKPPTTLRPPRLDVELFVAEFAPPPCVLLLGGGPDARPVATLGEFLGWHVTVVDHRAAYLAPGRFPGATRLVESPAAGLSAAVDLSAFAAAVVMSHHLDSDRLYLQALASSPVPYVGLLGPPARRERLLADLGADTEKLRSRLRAPVGLDIGGRTPEAIALSIVGEIHAVLGGRAGQPFSS
jgi:xanthine dehydrogenase accessory factor